LWRQDPADPEHQVERLPAELDWRTGFPGFAGGRGTAAARLSAARRFARLAILYIVSGMTK
jgi:hypothetical protein